MGWCLNGLVPKWVATLSFTKKITNIKEMPLILVPVGI